MRQRLVITGSILAFAFLVLFTSILRSSAVKYAFSQESTPMPASSLGEIESMSIDYYLPYPGGVLQDHPLWPLKAARDKLWLFLTTDPTKKAELYLLLADKRLASADLLLTKEKSELAVSSLTKAEKYLEVALKEEEKAGKSGIATGELLDRLAKASLKHRQVLETMLLKVPEDAKPIVVQAMDSPKKAFKQVSVRLRELNRTVPSNPFGEE